MAVKEMRKDIMHVDIKPTKMPRTSYIEALRFPNRGKPARPAHHSPRSKLTIAANGMGRKTHLGVCLETLIILFHNMSTHTGRKVALPPYRRCLDSEFTQLSIGRKQDTSEPLRLSQSY